METTLFEGEWAVLRDLQGPRRNAAVLKSEIGPPETRIWKIGGPRPALVATNSENDGWAVHGEVLRTLLPDVTSEHFANMLRAAH